LALPTLPINESTDTIDGAADDEQSVSTTSLSSTQEASSSVGHILEVVTVDTDRPSTGLPVVETVESDEEPIEIEC
jgi:hypothetical protein